MILALGIALSSIALGAVLGLLPRSARRSGSPFQTFAMVMSIAVVLGQLLPEALRELGPAALAAFGVGFVVPRAAERLASAFSRPACLHDDAMCTDLGLELGYLGLLLHHVGDGIGLGLYAGPLHAGHGHYDVLAALAGHTVPLTALVVLAFRTHRGPVDAALRALGIALSTVLGVALASMLSVEQLAVWEPWLTAFVGGLLLHVVAHGWPAEVSPTRRSRWMDFAALAAGVAMLSFGGHSHAGETGSAESHGATAAALLGLLLETAPMLLLGLGLAAWVASRAARIPMHSVQGAGPLRAALQGAWLGAPRPLWTCGVLPVAQSLHARGAAGSVVVAFLLATPQFGIETFALNVQFLGWPLACLRLTGAVLVAIAAAWIVGRVIKPAAGGSGAEVVSYVAEVTSRPTESPPERGLVRDWLANFDSLVDHVGAWTLVGLIGAAYLQSAVSDGALRSLADSGLDIVLVTVLAVPSYVCAAAATPLAAVLLGKGVSAGAVLAGLLLGPATHLAALAWLRRTFGLRATLWAGAGLLGTTGLLALLANRFLPFPSATATLGHADAYGPLSYASAVLLTLLLLRSVWRTGLRTWLGALGETFTTGATIRSPGPQAVRPDEHAGHAHSHNHRHGEHAHHDHAHRHAAS